MGTEISGNACLIFKEFHDSIKKSNTICANSSEILSLNTEDILSFAQLKSKTFFKNNFEFNISKTVLEILNTHQHFSQSKQLRVNSHFFDFPSRIQDDSFESLEIGKEILDFSIVNMVVLSDQLKVK